MRKRNDSFFFGDAMTVIRWTYYSSIVMLLVCSGCTETAVSPAPAAGEHTLAVTVVTHDEFDRPVASAGSITLTLVGEDRTVRTTLSDGRSTHAFHGLPMQWFLLSAQKEGYYRSETPAGAVYTYGVWTPTLHLFPHPSATWKIDSIAVTSGPTAGMYSIRLVTARMAPSTYRWRAALFIGRQSPIDPATGVYDMTTVGDGTGTTIMATVGKYQFTVPSGTRLYVTARLMTPATTATYDQDLHHSRYLNLEANTTVVSSFVMQ